MPERDSASTSLVQVRGDRVQTRDLACATPSSGMRKGPDLCLKQHFGEALTGGMNATPLVSKSRPDVAGRLLCVSLRIPGGVTSTALAAPGLAAAAALFHGFSDPTRLAIGFGLAVASLAIMPFLSRAQRRTAVLLAGLVLNAALVRARGPAPARRPGCAPARRGRR